MGNTVTSCLQTDYTTGVTLVYQRTRRNTITPSSQRVHTSVAKGSGEHRHIFFTNGLYHRGYTGAAKGSSARALSCVCVHSPIRARPPAPPHPPTYARSPAPLLPPAPCLPSAPSLRPAHSLLSALVRQHPPSPYAL